MKEIFRKIILILKGCFFKVINKLSLVIKNRLSPAIKRKREQVKKNYKMKIDRKREIISFQVREAFNKIRINMDTLSSESRNKCILISSPNIADGKTTICLYLAKYMAQFGKRTLIIDCNMRSAKMSAILDADKNTHGLSDILADGINPREAIIAANVNDLYIITAGRPAVDPVGLLGCMKMNNLIESLMDEFDYILLDTPAILLVPDTIALAKHTANIYLVVRHNYTKNQDIISALDALNLINRNAKGIIYNDAPIEQYDSNLIYNSNEIINYTY